MEVKQRWRVSPSVDYHLQSHHVLANRYAWAGSRATYIPQDSLSTCQQIGR